MYTLDEAGLLDAFYHFVDDSGFLNVMADVKLPGVKRVLLPVLPVVLRYLLKTR